MVLLWVSDLYLFEGMHLLFSEKKDCALFGLYISYLGGLVSLLAGIDVTQRHISYTMEILD